MPPARRRAPGPDVVALAALSGPPAAGRLKKADPTDPVLGLASQENQAAAAVEPTPTGDRRSAAPSEPHRTEPAAAARGRETVHRSGGKVKVGYYQAPDDMARARAAFDWTRPREGHRSLSDFIAHAVLREVERLEQLYNDGEPWPPLDPGQLPSGRPVGT